jgi:hypothetical protein
MMALNIKIILKGLILILVEKHIPHTKTRKYPFLALWGL